MERLSTLIDEYRSPRNTNSPTNTKPRLNKWGKDRADLLDDLGLTEPLKTFANFKPLSGTPQAYTAIRQLADGIGDARMLLVYGSSGCGKTHLLKAAILRLYGRGIFARYRTWWQVTHALRDGFGDHAVPGYRQILHNHCAAPALVIDDIGMGSTWTPWEASQFEELIDARYDRRLVTLMATNWRPDELPDRVISRLRDPFVGALVLNSASDYRRGNAN